MKVKKSNEELCMWCGRESATEEHHLFRRSISPQLKDDPNNKVKLGRICHRYATENKEIEELFQKYFFLRPEAEELSVEYIAEEMKKRPVLSPRDIMRFRNFLAATYSFKSAKYNELNNQKPFLVEKYWQDCEGKSEARAERLYAMNEGQEYNRLKTGLKGLEKLISALRTSHEQVVREAQNYF